MKKPVATSTQVFRLSSLTALLLSLGMANVFAGSLDDVSQPPPTDPSAFSDPAADPVAQAAALEALKSMPEANEGSLELSNGAYGTRATVTSNNVLPPTLQTSRKYPTNGKPSPLFGAEPFTQQLLLFEEFGPEKLDPATPPYS
ncbi:copper oxidase, partial [Pseudomonas sp. FW305-127]